MKEAHLESTISQSYVIAAHARAHPLQRANARIRKRRCGKRGKQKNPHDPIPARDARECPGIGIIRGIKSARLSLNDASAGGISGKHFSALARRAKSFQCLMSRANANVSRVQRLRVQPWALLPVGITV
jgi:hypothetical protein